MNMPFPTSQPCGVLVFFCFKKARREKFSSDLLMEDAKVQSQFYPKPLTVVDLCEIILTLASRENLNLPYLRAGEGAKTSFFLLYDVFLSNPSFLFVDVLRGYHYLKMFFQDALAPKLG